MGAKININLTSKGEIFMYSAIPPHTPNNALSVDDFLSFFNPIPPNQETLLLLYTFLISNKFHLLDKT